MSTAGKVLTVLVTLMAIVWIVLVAGVAQYNMTGTQLVKDLTEKTAKLEEQLDETLKSIVDLKAQINQEQVSMAEDLAVLQSRQSDMEKAKSDTLEIALRVKLQLAGIEAAVKTAQLDRDHRIAELKAENEAKDAAEKEVAKLKTENGDLMTELAKLRDDFKKTLESNKESLERLRKASTRTTRPASLSH